MRLFSQDQHCSILLKSGEYSGKYNSLHLQFESILESDRLYERWHYPSRPPALLPVLELNSFPATFQKLFGYTQLARKRGTQFIVTQSIRYRIDSTLAYGCRCMEPLTSLVHSHNHIDLGYPYLIHQHTQSDLEGCLTT